MRGNTLYELSNHLGNVLVTVSDKKIPVLAAGGTIDYYKPDVLTANDYYPFGMQMPGRNGYKGVGGWAEGLGGTSGLPERLTVENRSGNKPAEYVATKEIAMVEGFESGSEDVFVAYITDGAGSSGAASGSGSIVSGYRYGFNGKENDNEVKGEGNQQDYGMRIYDPRVGRFLSVDLISKKYPNLTPYQFASNTPIQAIDQDGLEAFFVHGTAASNKRWFHPKSDESPVDNTLINGLLPMTRNTVPPDVTFNWHRIVSDGYNNNTGQMMTHSINGLTNNKADRKIAAQDLVEHVMTYRRVHGIDSYNDKGELVKMGNEPITFITHSHGGNVAIQAANMIFDKYKVQSDIIAIAVPAYTGKNDIENPANARGVRKLIDIWNQIDGVSGGLAGSNYYPIGPNSKVKRIEVDASKHFKPWQWQQAHSYDNNYMKEFVDQVKKNDDSQSLKNEQPR